MYDFDVRAFIDQYFEENDSKLMEELDETIGSSEDPVEISTLGDWIFRNYIADAFSETINENNKFILSKVKEMIENACSTKKKKKIKEVLEIPQELKDELNLDWFLMKYFLFYRSLRYSEGKNMVLNKNLFYFMFIFCLILSVLPVYADLEVSEKHIDFGVLMRPKTKKLIVF